LMNIEVRDARNGATPTPQHSPNSPIRENTVAGFLPAARTIVAKELR